MVTHATVQEIILGYHLMLIPREIMMVEGNRVASVILFIFTSEPCPHAHTACVNEAPTPLLTHSSTDQLPAK